MGFISTSIKVSNPHDSLKSITLNLLVDTGATFTVIPSQELEKMSIKPRVKRRLRTADGRVVEREGATILAQIMDKRDEVPVVFGGKDDSPVIGITTLEILGFEADPITGRLKPSEYLLLYTGKWYNNVNLREGENQVGHVYTTIKISNMERTKVTEVQAVADTSATLTVIPQKLALELELGEVSRERVRTGAGRIELKRSAARISIGDREAPQPVLISDFIDRVLLGAVTLEALALSLDPLTGELKEEMLLLY